MIPARPSIPPRRSPAIQLNRLFESREELDKFLLVEFPEYESVKVVRTWTVPMIAATVEFGKKKK